MSWSEVASLSTGSLHHDQMTLGYCFVRDTVKFTVQVNEVKIKLVTEYSSARRTFWDDFIAHCHLNGCESMAMVRKGPDPASVDVQH